VIVVSLLLFVLGVGLLVAGLVVESIGLEVGAIAAASGSAVALYVGVRQRPPASEPAEHWIAPEDAPQTGRSVEDGSAPSPAEQAPATDPVEVEAPPPKRAESAEVAAGSATEAELAEPAVGEPAVGEPAVGEPVVGEPVADVPAVDTDEPDSDLDDEPDDEPDEEVVSLLDVGRVALRSDEVLVVDGRPRYHRPDCSSLAGRETVPLPVSEAFETGFTPCARCSPAAHLMATSDPPQGG